MQNIEYDVSGSIKVLDRYLKFEYVEARVSRVCILGIVIMVLSRYLMFEYLNPLRMVLCPYMDLKIANNNCPCSYPLFWDIGHHCRHFGGPCLGSGSSCALWGGVWIAVPRGSASAKKEHLHQPLHYFSLPQLRVLFI